MPYTPPFKQTAEINNLCLEIAELVGSLRFSSQLTTNPTLHRELRIKTIHSSLVIEGNQLSSEAVTDIINGKRVLGPKKDILEVENAMRAYEHLGKYDHLSLEDLLHAHRLMMEGLIPDAGMFRSGDVGVFDGDTLIHAGTPARYVPTVMRDLFDWMQTTELHPLLVSCIFHFEFEFIHPFADGNGRTGRLWQTLILSRWRSALAWLPVESAILNHRSEYYAALAQSDAEGSSEAFVTLMLCIIREALLPYASLEEESAADTETQALSYFLGHPKATIRELAGQLQLSQRSAERLVAHLKEKGSLVRNGSARGGFWTVNRFR